MHAHSHTHMHMHTHTYMYMHSHTHTHTHMHAHTHTHVHTHTHTPLSHDARVPPLQPAPVAEEVSGGEVDDLKQRLAILQAKRQEDKARLKELEKYRIQVQQVSTVTQLYTCIYMYLL